MVEVTIFQTYFGPDQIIIPLSISLTLTPIRGQYTGHMITLNQSEPSTTEPEVPFNLLMHLLLCLDPDSITFMSLF